MKILFLIALLFSSQSFAGLNFLTPLKTLSTPSFQDLYSSDLSGGTNYIDCGGGASLDPDYHSVSVSFGAWIYPTGAGVIVGNTNNGGTYKGMTFTMTNDIAIKDLELYLVSLYPASTLLINTPANTVVYNTWQHVGFKTDGTFSGTEIYVNGVAQPKNAYFNTLTTSTSGSTQPFTIGYSKLEGTSLPGKIDEAFFVNGTALPDSDFLAIYNAGHPASLAAYSPTSWWRVENNYLDTQGLNNCAAVGSPIFSSSVP